MHVVTVILTLVLVEFSFWPTVADLGICLRGIILPFFLLKELRNFQVIYLYC